MKAAVINEATNEVVNVIELEKDAKWEPPKGFKVVFSDEAEIGKIYYEKKFRDA